MCFMKDVDIGLQVSLSETFNIVAADLVSNNIPVVGSHEISWLSRFFKADPNSSSDIAAALLFVYKVKRFNLHYLNNFYLFCYNFIAKRKWLKFLEA